MADPPDDNPTRHRSVEIATVRESSVLGAAETVPIGIDLGTCNTCASAVLGGKPLVLPTRFGPNTVPSVVSLGPAGNILVGHAATKRLVLEPEATVYGSKRLIGRTYTDEVASEYQRHFAYRLVETPDHRFGAALGGLVVSMEQVATYILNDVRAITEEHLGRRIRHAVITCPAYFSEVQRDAVREAAKKAGINVARVVNEPTAAAVAFGFNRTDKARIAIFDLGGGTFDMSILQIGGNRFEVLATGGDDFLGGIDFDDRIAALLLDTFKKTERVELDPTPQQVARLREAAEEAKRHLSMQSRIQVRVPQFAEVRGTLKDLGTTLDRAQFDKVTEELLKRTMDITASVLDGAKIPVMSIDTVLLVGGMTRVPTVQARVEKFFGKPPSRRVNPDEAVAIGAALLSAEPADTSVTLIDVLPLSIGVVGPGRKMMRLIPRNTAVPTMREFIVRTKQDQQTRYSEHLFQGERADALRNEYLGTVVISGIPPAPAGAQPITLSVGLDHQGMLSLTTPDPSAPYTLRLDRTRSVTDIAREYGPVPGAAAANPRPPSALGRFFGRIRSLFGGG